MDNSFQSILLPSPLPQQKAQAGLSKMAPFPPVGFLFVVPASSELLDSFFFPLPFLGLRGFAYFFPPFFSLSLLYFHLRLLG